MYKPGGRPENFIKTQTSSEETTIDENLVQTTPKNATATA
jgi:hypothetical protein